MRLCGVLLLSTVILHSVIFPSDSFADGAYKWKDSDGRTHYGSSPPKNAINVQSLSGKSFSRYSSDRMLRPYGSGARTTVSETDVASGKMYSKPSKAKAKIMEPEPLPDPVMEETLVPELEQGPIVVKHDKSKRVVECSVVVRNTASIPANNVIVNFEFDDGTLVPSAGPESIDAGSSAKYSVPEAMLPITVSGIVSDSPGPKPKVLIKGGA